jgi:hypothetical protein
VTGNEDGEAEWHRDSRWQQRCRRRNRIVIVTYAFERFPVVDWRAGGESMAVQNSFQVMLKTRCPTDATRAATIAAWKPMADAVYPAIAAIKAFAFLLSEETALRYRGALVQSAAYNSVRTKSRQCDALSRERTVGNDLWNVLELLELVLFKC